MPLYNGTRTVACVKTAVNDLKLVIHYFRTNHSNIHKKQKKNKYYSISHLRDNLQIQMAVILYVR